MQTRQRHLTIIEGNNPALRRHTISGLSTLFRKSSVSQSFLSFFEDIPKKLTLRQSQVLIKNHFQKMNCIIDSVDEFILRRLQNHQNQVFALVKGQIQEMRQSTAKIATQLNQRITQLSAEEEIYNLQNELDYFRNEACKLFQENNKYREQIVQLKRSIKDFEIEVENGDVVMQKLKRRVMKRTFKKQQIINKIVANLSGEENKQKFKLSLDRQNINDLITKRMKTDTSDQRPSLNAVINEQQIQSIDNLNSFDKNHQEDHYKSISVKNSISSVSYKQEALLDLDDVDIDQIDSINLDSQKPSTQQGEILKGDFEQKPELNQIEIGVQTDFPFSIQSFSTVRKQLVESQVVQKSKQFIKSKDINLIRSGFIVNPQKQNPPKFSLPKSIRGSENEKSQTRRQRFMSSAFAKNKLPCIQGTIAVRQKTPKSSFHH